jgi:peroxiredoxin
MVNENNFIKQFCEKKKIDFEKLAKEEPDLFKKWNLMLEQMNEESFTMRELYIINKIRRKYPLIKFLK